MSTKKNNETIAENEPAGQAEAIEEHHAALDALAAQAFASEAQIDTVNDTATASEAEAKAQNWAEIPAMLGSLLSMIEPKLSLVYSQDACMNWGRCMVPVADKYGWGDAPLGCEVPLAVATLGLAVPSYMLIKAHLEKIKQQPKPQDQQPQQTEVKTEPQNAEPKAPWAVPTL